MAKRFMFVCLGLLALAVAYHLGAAKAESYTGSPFVSLMSWNGSQGGTVYLLALTEDGTVYWANGQGGWPEYLSFPQWQVWGQIPTGATATQSSTWGQIKAQLGK
jgi:hypothetical protein